MLMQKQSIKNTLVFCFPSAKLVVFYRLGFKICCKDDKKSNNATYFCIIVSFFRFNLINCSLSLAFYYNFVIRFGGEDEVCHHHLAI